MYKPVFYCAKVCAQTGYKNVFGVLNNVRVEKGRSLYKVCAGFVHKSTHSFGMVPYLKRAACEQYAQGLLLKLLVY